METIETLLKELKMDLVRTEKKYFNADWNPDFDDMAKLRALSIREKEMLQILLKSMKLQEKLKSQYEFVVKYKQEVERNVLIPKINKE